MVSSSNDLRTRQTHIGEKPQASVLGFPPGGTCTMRLKRFHDLVTHGHGWIEGRGRILRHKPYLRAADFLQLARWQAQEIAPQEAHCAAIEPAHGSVIPEQRIRRCGLPAARFPSHAQRLAREDVK